MPRRNTSAGMLRVPLQAVIDRAMERAEEGSVPRGYIGASMVWQECERAVWYDWLWATPRVWSGRMLRRFETGHMMEPRVIRELILALYDVHAENPRARNDKKQYAAEGLGGLFRGHVDGFVRGGPEELYLDAWHLLEIKAMGSGKYAYADDDEDYSTPIANRDPTKHLTAAGNAPSIEGRWWKTRRRGVRAAEPHYWGQLQSYMGMSREKTASGKPHWQAWGLDAPLDTALFVAVNTDTEQIHAELVGYEPEAWLEIKRRVIRVMRDRDSGPQRVRETPLYPPCRFCDHRGACHGTTPIRPSCRSCTHAVVRVPGEAGFYGRRSQWMCTRHGHGCGDFTACDDYASLIPEATF